MELKTKKNAEKEDLEIKLGFVYISVICTWRFDNIVIKRFNCIKLCLDLSCP